MRVHGFCLTNASKSAHVIIGDQPQQQSSKHIKHETNQNNIKHAQSSKHIMCMHIIIMHMHAYDCMRLQIGWVGEMGGWEDGGDGGRAGWLYLS